MPAQRLSLSATATASSTGTALFQFPAPPTNLVYIGTLTLAIAPSGAAFSASVGGFPWCSWAGPSVGGPVQALPGEVVTVAATGLTAGVTYTLQWTGRSNSAQETQPEYPDTNSSAGGAISQAPGTSLTVQLSGGALQATGTLASAGTATVLAAPATGSTYLLHNVTFTLGSGATLAQLVGATSGFIYCQVASTSELFSALDGQIAAEGLVIVAVGGGASLWLSYDNGSTVGGSSGGGGGGGGGGGVSGGNAWYASGADGSVTFDGSSVVLGLTPSASVYTLNRDIVPALMTVNSGVTINTNGYRIYVHGPLVNNGHINRDGNAGTAGSGAGNAPGGAPLQNVNAPLEGSTIIGKGGGQGEANAGGQNGTGDATHPITGGSAGNGGSGSGGGGGTGGAGGLLGASEGNIANPITVSTGANGGANFECGAGGGGGGGSVGHAGGGGGGGAGHVVIAALSITGSGSITATGGAGGNGDPAGNTGGGGGGGGGLVHILSGSVVNGAIPGQTVTANGGAGGTGAGSGTNGGNGLAGVVAMITN